MNNKIAWTCWIIVLICGIVIGGTLVFLDEKEIEEVEVEKVYEGSCKEIAIASNGTVRCFENDGEFMGGGAGGNISEISMVGADGGLGGKIE